MTSWLIYGANGYTGALVARLAVAQGLKPVLAGRNAGELQALARELGLAARPFALDDAAAADAALKGARLVLHCAGPFSHTSRPLVDACLRARAHYLDITGEIAVIEALAARHAEARARGLMLLPACGFDVVPSDCLAVHLKRRLPGALTLTLAYAGFGRVSRGTAATAIEGLGRPALVRQAGALTSVPLGWRTRLVDFGYGPVPVMTVPLADVATAWHSTAIPDIETALAAPQALRLLAHAGRYAGPLLRSAPLRRFLLRRVRAGAPGPTEAERQRGRAFVWGEVRDGEGRTAVSRVQTREGYTFTAQAALAIATRVLAGRAPKGFQTPASAYGPELVLELEGVRREDLPIVAPAAREPLVEAGPDRRA